MKVVCTAIIDEKPIATFEADSKWATFVGRGRVCNQAFYSDLQARIWGRLVFDGVTEWVTHYVEAPGAEPYYYEGIPGSFLSRFESEVPEFFPDELLLREFDLHVDFMKRKL